MKAGSLRLRLILGGAMAVLVALAVSWLAMTWLFERHIERRETDELTRVALNLVAGLSVDPAGKPVVAAAPVDPRLQTPAGGLYWQVSTPTGAVRSRSLWDQALKPPVEASAGSRRARITAGPFDDRILVVERRVRPDHAGPVVLVQVASEEKALRAARAGVRAGPGHIPGRVVDRAVGGRHGPGACRACRPWPGLRADLATAARAVLPPAWPTTIRVRSPPLIGAINDLRATAARGRPGPRPPPGRRPWPTASRPPGRPVGPEPPCRAAGAVDAADGLDRAIEAMAAALETELARARPPRRGDATIHAQAEVLAVVERLVAVVERTAEGQRLMFDVEIDPALRARRRGRPDRDAGRPDRERRPLRPPPGAGDGRAEVEGGVRLSIDDDGPGMEEGAPRPPSCAADGWTRRAPAMAWAWPSSAIWSRPRARCP